MIVFSSVCVWNVAHRPLEQALFCLCELCSYFNILNLSVFYHRALFTYEGNSNDIRLAEKGGEWILLSSVFLFCFYLYSILSNVCWNLAVSIHAAALEYQHKRFACLCLLTPSFVTGGKNAHSYTTDRSNHLTFPQCLCIRWRTGGAGWGVEQWKSDVCFLPGPGSKFWSA